MELLPDDPPDAQDVESDDEFCENTPISHDQGRDVPRPLQIIKRTATRHSHSDNCRASSMESYGSDGSVGGDRPLTVPKRRSNKAEVDDENRPWSVLSKQPSLLFLDRGHDVTPCRPSARHRTKKSAWQDTTPHAFVLVPRIVVTPECKTLDGGVGSFWAAVEVSTQLCQPHMAESILAGELQGDMSQYGCLYDTRLEISAGASSTVVDILDHGVPSSTMYPGSRLLKLVHVALTTRPRGQGHRRQKSDELFDHLEHQLGSTTTEYLQIRFVYRHSGFPQKADGLCATQTTMETHATAVIKRHNPASPWSPRPTPQPNPLFEMMTSHWGPQEANRTMHRMLASRASNKTSPRRVAMLPSHAVAVDARSDGAEVPPQEPTRAAPPVPQRKTSLRYQELTEDQDRQHGDADDKATGNTGEGAKFWTAMRRVSAGAGRHGRRASYMADENRDQCRGGRTPRARRSAGPDVLRGLVPMTAAGRTSLDGRDKDKDKEGSRWGWSAWW